MEELDVNEILEFPILSFEEFKITVAKILLFIAVLVATRIVYGLISISIKRASRSRDMLDAAKSHALRKMAKYFIYTIGLILAIQSLGIDIGLIWASSAALFVGIGFGLQNVFNDMISGIIILLEGEIKKGDILEINGTVGRVETVDIRTSKIFTRDGIRIIIPNSDLTSHEIINWSYNDQLTRFKITVGVAYGSDTKLVTKILEKCAEEHKEVSDKHPVRVRFIDFGDSALIFELYFWAFKTWEIEWVRSDLRYSIDNEFRKNGVQIPFPQRDLHVRSDETKNP